MSRKSKFNILLAEDDATDRRLFYLALKRNGDSEQAGEITIHEAHDGMEVIEYLKGAGKFKDRFHYPIPQLLIVDLKMPKFDGLEVISWIRKHKGFSRLPIVMLSGSGLNKDIVEAYRLGVNSYFTKPSDFRKFQRLLSTVFEYWLLSEKPDGDEGI